MDSPILPSSSRPSTPVNALQEDSSARENDETTYDFTNLDDAASAGEKEDEERAKLKTSLSRPRLVRRDKSEDHLEAGRRALASSIIEKAQSIAAALNAAPQSTAPKSPGKPIPVVQHAQEEKEKIAVKHVRISTEEEVIAAVASTKPITSRPSKIPKMATSGVKRSSRIPVPTKRSTVNTQGANKAISKHVAWEEQG